MAQQGLRLLVLASLLVGVGCDDGSSQHPCEGMVAQTYVTPDGCNHCTVCGEDYWECTQKACYGPGFQVKRACLRQPCVSDVDEASPGLQPDCSVGLEKVEGTMTPVPPCEGAGEAPQLPMGAESCFYLRTGDALSDECVEEGAAIEFEFLTDWGGRTEDPGDSGQIFWVHCAAPSFLEWYYDGVTCWGPGPDSESWEW